MSTTYTLGSEHGAVVCELLPGHDYTVGELGEFRVAGNVRCRGILAQQLNEKTALVRGVSPRQLDEPVYLDGLYAGPLPHLTEYGFLRRNDITQQVPAEAAIRAAMRAVEAMAPHPLLTDAVLLLDQALNKVADFVELSGKAE